MESHDHERLRREFQDSAFSESHDYEHEYVATITVAICARNAEEIIVACLENIRGQTVAPDEVIVALDELSDPTGVATLREC